MARNCLPNPTFTNNKPHFSFKYCAFFVILVFTACTPTVPNFPTIQPELTASPETPTVTSTQTIQPTFTPSPSPTVTAAPQDDQTRYSLTAVLDYQTQQLSVQESIQYTNRSMDTLNDLVLVVEPTFQADLFTLVEASWSDGDPIENILPEAGRLTIPLQTGLTGGQSIGLQLTYTLNLPQTPGTLCFTDRQINLTGWYAYIPPYLTGQGWVAHTPSSVGEYQVFELADYTVQFRIDNAPAGLVVASSSEAVINSEWYEYHQTDARTFSLSISPYYQVIETLAGTTTIREYYFIEDEFPAQTVLTATSQAISFYSQIFGPNDRDYLAVIEGTFPDGMEYDGMYYLGEEYYQSYNGN
ncbi:MAG TPA: hypothetical protein VN376_04345, partial [Longilinea sp.]|nr:hypothetical protein [Longilinea sp.]